MNYDNNDYVGYDYDDYERVIGSYNETGELATYDYNRSGFLSRVTDTASGGTYVTEYTYDLLGRLTDSIQTGIRTDRFKYAYDTMSRPTGMYILDGSQYSGSTFTYGSNSVLTGISLNGTGYSYGYDNLSRVTTEKTVNNKVCASYSYVAGNATNKTTALINSITYSCLGTTNGSLAYTYDNDGNILTVTDNAGKTVGYAYDYLGQLTRVNDQKHNVTTVYTYGQGGNIAQKKTYAYTTGTLGTALSTINYAYGHPTWKDLLTSYNSTAISYDGIGNPLNWPGMTNLTWQRGRQLTSLQKGTTAVSYVYNSDGLRAKKTVGSTVTSFSYNDMGLLAKQTTGANKLIFFYDNAGNIKAMEYNGTRYFLRRNAQGDVIALLLESGAVVANYSYDAWGKLLSVTDSSGNAITSTAHIANINPIRYRGYYYDTETGFYSLQSRYYDPEIGRFINADSQLNTDAGMTGYNLFCYGGNNPVNTTDPTGHAFMFLTAAICAVVGAVTGGIIAAEKGKNVWAGIGIGAAAGGLIGLGAGAAAATLITGSATASTAVILGTTSMKLAATGTTLGIGASKVIDKVANGYQKVKSVVLGATDVFRSVSSAELSDIKSTGQFNLPAGGMESKQFAFSCSEAMKFGSQSIINQTSIVSASVPNSMLNQFCSIGVDTGIFTSGTMTVYGDMLGQFNQAVAGTIQIMP